MSPDKASLADWVDRFQLSVPAGSLPALNAYCRELWVWNQSVNLTRHTSFESFASRDLPDVIQLSNLLTPAEHVLDVGSGGGLTGIPLAIIRPDLRVTLCDSVAKKTRILQEMVAKLGLDAIVRHGRAEQIAAGEAFDSLVIRAVAPLHKILTWFSPCWKLIRQVFLVKGHSWAEERAAARRLGLLKKLELRKVAQYTRPGDDFPTVILRVATK